MTSIFNDFKIEDFFYTAVKLEECLDIWLSIGLILYLILRNFIKNQKKIKKIKSQINYLEDFFIVRSKEIIKQIIQETQQEKEKEKDRKRKDE